MDETDLLTRAKLGYGLDVLTASLRIYVSKNRDKLKVSTDEWSKFLGYYGKLTTDRPSVQHSTPSEWDAAVLLGCLEHCLDGVLRKDQGITKREREMAKGWIVTLIDARKRWAHQSTIKDHEVLMYLSAMSYLLEFLGMGSDALSIRRLATGTVKFHLMESGESQAFRELCPVPPKAIESSGIEDLERGGRKEAKNHVVEHYSPVDFQANKPDPIAITINVSNPEHKSLDIFYYIKHMAVVMLNALRWFHRHSRMTLKAIFHKKVLVPVVLCATLAGVAFTIDKYYKPIHSSKSLYIKGKQLLEVNPIQVENSIKWLTIAARRGSMDAMFHLGFIFDGGIMDAMGASLVTVDHNRAFYWYRRAANLGHVGAMVNCAGMIAAQKVTSMPDGSDPKQYAINLYEKAASLNYEWALFRLGEHYESGLWVEKNYTKALEYYRRAAALGHSQAKSKL